MATAPFFSEERRLPGDGVTLVLYGELDKETAPFARRAITKAAGAYSGPLVIDVGCVLVADTFGLAALLKARHRYGAAIVNLSPAVEEAARKADETGRFARAEPVERAESRA